MFTKIAWGLELLLLLYRWIQRVRTFRRIAQLGARAPTATRFPFGKLGIYAWTLKRCPDYMSLIHNLGSSLPAARLRTDQTFATSLSPPVTLKFYRLHLDVTVLRVTCLQSSSLLTESTRNIHFIFFPLTRFQNGEVFRIRRLLS